MHSGGGTLYSLLHGTQARTVTLKMKTVGFEVKSRGLTLPTFICNFEELNHVASDLLQREISASNPVPLRLRLMGMYLCRKFN